MENNIEFNFDNTLINQETYNKYQNLLKSKVEELSNIKNQ